MRVIYQYQFRTDATVAHRLDFPILFSIATLRAWHPEAEVVVLEYEGGRLDWEDFPDRLGFRRLPAPPYDRSTHDGLIPFLMARPSHVWEHASGLTCYCDSDVLWLDRLPDLDRRYVHINESNAGFYLFDPSAYRAAGFLGLWSHFCEEAIRDRRVRDAIRADDPEPYLHDESVFRFLRGAYPELIGRWLWFLSKEDLALPWHLPGPRSGRLHLVKGICGERRGSLAWLLRESRPALERAFTDDELRTILGPDYDLGGTYSLDTIHQAIRMLGR